MEEIKAGDIMIGNWVMFENTTHVVTEISETLIATRWIKSKDKYIHTLSELRPIPLTEDILLNAGAIPYTTKCTFILGNIIIDIKLGIAMLNCIDSTPLLCKCKYLHTFQNIIKLLTGNDLKIEV